MRRNVVSLLKFICLAICTVFLTVVIFRYVRGPRRVKIIQHQVNLHDNNNEHHQQQQLSEVKHFFYHLKI